MNIQNSRRMSARRIQVDNARQCGLVVMAGLPAGTEFFRWLVLNHFVPQGHKVALADIVMAGNIVRYGEVIALQGDITRGD